MTGKTQQKKKKKIMDCCFKSHKQLAAREADPYTYIHKN